MSRASLEASADPSGPRWWRGAAAAAVLVGIALRLWQLLSFPAVWVDEAALVRNVLDRDAASLLAPLDYGQVAPPGLLVGAKLATALLGDSEIALRLLPFAAGIAAVVL